MTVRRITKDEAELMAFWVTEINCHMSASDFQRDFFDSLEGQFVSSGSLTEKQRDSLQKIYERVTS